MILNKKTNEKINIDNDIVSFTKSLYSKIILQLIEFVQ